VAIVISLIPRGGGHPPIRVLVATTDRRRKARIARAMAAARLPEHAIARALRMSRRRLAQVLAGTDLWTADMAQLIAREMAAA
jgi:hypothetical protein